MKYSKKTLKNGLRIITVPMPNSLTTTVLVLTETGSKYETKKLNGISHFLEHMCFKGTERRPNAHTITSELDNLGARSNAFTGHEYTGYYAQAEPRHFDAMLDVVSDIFLNSIFPKEDIERERGVIIGEIDMYEDTPRDLVGDLFSDVLYGDQPAGWKIIGPKENINKIQRKDFIEYKKKNYVASSTIVVVAGSFDKRSAIKAIEKAFKDVTTHKKSKKKKIIEKQLSSQVLVNFKKTNQTHFVLGFRSFDINDTRVVTAVVLGAVLGFGMSSRLFRKVREEMGAGYYVGAGNDFFTDHGFLAAYAGVSNKRIEEVIVAILLEMKRLKEELVDEKELRKTKNLITGELVAGLETSTSQAMYYGIDEVSRTELKTPQERIKDIRAVTAEQVMDLARDIFVKKNLNLALIGPFRDSKKFKKLLKI